VAVVKMPAQAIVVKEAFVPSSSLVGIVLQAWRVEVLPSRDLFVPAMLFVDSVVAGMDMVVMGAVEMADRKAGNSVAVPG
jgi:hypothetical protein